MKAIFVFSMFFISPFLSKSQTKSLSSQDGINVTYELTKIDENSKKETYLAVVKAVNNNDFDLYYEVPLTTLPNGTYSVNFLQNKSFAQIVVRNSTSLIGDNINLNGTETKLITTDRKVLFVVTKGTSVIGEKEFKVKKGENPILTNTFLFSLKGLENYDLEVSDNQIEGEWQSSCGDSKFNVSIAEVNNEKRLIQLVNGKQIYWKKEGSNTFKKVSDDGTLLLYNKLKRNFTYTSTEGITCIWTKK